ncbi:autotransporter outer membrane beta-barrel domain-containing protein [Rhodobacteraceae bacterium D3-12]|nr:autotransporter outer membrane beta-barrel domain-containing protein [Rhodobacteraceae bacterium D3-12]
MTKFLVRLRGVLLALVVCAGVPQMAAAYNVPGSASANVPEITEVATGIVMRSLKQNVHALRQQSNGPIVATQGTLGFGTGQVPLAFSLDHRTFDSSTLDGRFDVATLFIGGRTDGGMTLFGGLVGEFGDLRTPLDAGRIEHSGFGLVAGVDYAVSDAVFLTAILGGMALDYDVSRGSGAFTGSFGAKRQFIDLSADYLTRGIGGSDMKLGFGLLYIHQRNDGYIESGGATVAPFTFDHLAATLAMRNTWGHDGGMRPYVDLSAQIRIAGDDGASAAVPVHADRQARLMIGVERNAGRSFFDVGLGANFVNDSYSGLDARLNYSFRF